MKRVRVLFIGSNPTDTNRLLLSHEVRTIDESLRAAEFRDYFELVQAWAVRQKDLQDVLLRHKPDLVHFSGHGVESGELVFEDEFGRANSISVEALSELFAIVSGSIRCVVLSACFSKVQADAIGKHVDCVIGIPGAIEDHSAIAFAGGFYRGLGWGRSIGTSFRLGCNEVDLAGLAENEHPRLLSKDELDSSEVYLLEPGILKPAPRPLQIYVTGGRDIPKRKTRLAFWVGYYVALRGHTIMSNGSTGVDAASSSGAFMACIANDLDSDGRIQLFRPRNSPSTKLGFDMGSLQIYGRNHRERMEYVIRQSDAVILIGGHRGTMSVAHQAEADRKPVVPIGVGTANEAAVGLWQTMRTNYEAAGIDASVTSKDWDRIGPNNVDLRDVAMSSVVIAERLVHVSWEERRLGSKY